jgi:hypothetical protein
MASTRKQAKAQGLKHYFTGLPCKNGHISQRTTSDYTCVVCNQVNTERYNLLNREKYLESKNSSYNKQQLKNLLYARQYRKNNPERRVALTVKYRATKLRRTPIWANYFEIKMFYDVAKVLSRGGVLFHVDHIVPLRGKEVSGLHVQDNLQVLPWHENLKKSIKFEESRTCM